MASFVPYVELVTTGNNVTGITWRIVNPSNPSTALTSVAGLTKVNIDVGTVENKKWVGYSIGEVSTGNKFSGTETQYTAASDAKQNISISLDKLDSVIVELTVSDANYRWIFTRVEPQVRFQFRTTIKAHLVNGKSSYDNLQVKGVHFSVDDHSDYHSKRDAPDPYYEISTPAEMNATC